MRRTRHVTIRAEQRCKRFFGLRTPFLFDEHHGFYDLQRMIAGKFMQTGNDFGFDAANALVHGKRLVGNDAIHFLRRVNVGMMPPLFEHADDAVSKLVLKHAATERFSRFDLGDHRALKARHQSV